MTAPLAAHRLRELRRLAARWGIPLDCADRLALRPREVARAIGFSLSTVEGWIRAGRLPAVQPDPKGGITVLVPDLVEFLEANYRRVRPCESSSVEQRAKALIDGAPQ